MTKPAELNAYLFDIRLRRLAREVMAWMEDCTLHRLCRDLPRQDRQENPRQPSIPDLRGELEAAYEPQGPRQRMRGRIWRSPGRLIQGSIF